MPMIMSTPMPLHVETDGDDRRPALLLINPLGADLSIWDPMMETLTQHHFVIRFDLRGHGRSVGPVEPYQIDDLGRDSLAVLDALDIPRAHVFGSSLGGLVAMWIAATHPDRIDRLVLASASTRLGPDQWWRETVARVEEGGTEAIADHLVEEVLFSERCRHDAESICETWRLMLLATPTDAYLAGAHAILAADMNEPAESIRASTLVVFGENDPMLRYFPATDLIDRIPDSEGVQVGGAAHGIIMEQAAAVASVVEDFLTDPDGR